jgi:hypothetical protein
MELQTRGSLALFLYNAYLLGKWESGTILSQELVMLRVLSPLTKLFTAKEGISVVSEGIEGFGGLGYMENSHIPSYLRDVQVNSIWEGTTNVVCWDFVRALQTCSSNIEQLGSWFVSSFNIATQSGSMLYQNNDEFKSSMNKIILIHNKLWPILEEISRSKVIKELWEVNLREIVFATAHLIIACLFIRILMERSSEDL